MPLARFDTWVRSAVGPAAAGAQVYVCTQPAVSTTVPPSPLVQFYSDAAGTVPISQPLVADGFGHSYGYVQPGTYTVVVVQFGLVQQVFPDQLIGGGAATVLVLQTNGVPNTVQSLLNLKGAGSVSVASDSVGGVTITGSQNAEGPENSVQVNNGGVLTGSSAFLATPYGDDTGLEVFLIDSESNVLQAQPNGLTMTAVAPGVNPSNPYTPFKSNVLYSANAGLNSPSYIGYESIGFQANIFVDGESGTQLASGIGVSAVVGGHACTTVIGTYSRIGSIESVGPTFGFGVLIDSPIWPNDYTPSQPGGGTVGNNYGLYIADQTGFPAPVTPFAIYVQGGASSFNDPVYINGGYATSVRTISSSYNATAQDSTINCTGALTVTLGPSTLTLTSVQSLDTGALTLYAIALQNGAWTLIGDIQGGGSNAYAGYKFMVSGFVNANNNGLVVCTASTTSSLTLSSLGNVDEGAAVAVTNVSETVSNVVTLAVTSNNNYRAGDSVFLDGLTVATWLNLDNLAEPVVLINPTNSTTLTFVDPSGNGFQSSSAETGFAYVNENCQAVSMTAKYNGTITGGGSNAYVGAVFSITGFTNSGNNVTSSRCTASTSGYLLLDNIDITNETQAAIATINPVVGQKYSIKNTGSGAVTLAAANNIDGSSTLPIAAAQSVDVQYDGSTWHATSQLATPKPPSGQNVWPTSYGGLVTANPALVVIGGSTWTQMLPGPLAYCNPSSWKFRLVAGSGTNIVTRASVAICAAGSLTVSSFTAVTFNGGSVGASFTTFVDSDAINVQIDSDHDYYLCVFYNASSGDAQYWQASSLNLGTGSYAVNQTGDQTAANPISASSGNNGNLFKKIVVA